MCTIDKVAGQPSASGLSPLAFAYTYNAANQRTAMTDATGDTWRYGYDALGQVTSAQKQKTDGGVRLGYDYAYTFDAIGNRKTTAANGLAATYTANLLNQYTQRQAPANVYVRGTAAADAHVTVEEQAAVRQDEAYALNVAVDAASTPALKTVKVVAVKNNYGPANEDLVAEQARTVFVPHPPEAFTHDLDGNLTQDGRWNYTWDAENRLTAMETRPDVAAVLPALKQKLEFAYDAQGRRIQKKVSNWNTASASYQLTSDTRFLYDDWNLVAELNASSLQPNATYVWGLDLSGSMQGAGGVGGLLFASTGSTTSAPAYDGNGNIVALIDLADGSLSAEYEFSPFGEVIKASGPSATANPFGFSTKYSDKETGLLYYGFRYYCPATGRWLSRDPSEERGGQNLYAFAVNDPIGRVDALGLVPEQSARNTPGFLRWLLGGSRNWVRISWSEFDTDGASVDALGSAWLDANQGNLAKICREAKQGESWVPFSGSPANLDLVSGIRWIGAWKGSARLASDGVLVKKQCKQCEFQYGLDLGAVDKSDFNPGETFGMRPFGYRIVFHDDWFIWIRDHTPLGYDYWIYADNYTVQTRSITIDD